MKAHVASLGAQASDARKRRFDPSATPRNIRGNESEDQVLEITIPEVGHPGREPRVVGGSAGLYETGVKCGF